MPFLLTKDLVFPPPNLAGPDGLLAIGGDLSVKRLILAYRKGIFPWYSKGEPILWWSPNPRFVLYPHELKVSKSMKQVLKNGQFTLTFDTCFNEVVQACKRIARKGQNGTWITRNMETAFQDLHQAGFAHSVEVWNTKTGELSGGLYGVSLGRHFYGESMFSFQSNASKYGFIVLVRQLAQQGFTLVDCQLHTDHLESLGARLISRTVFLELLEENKQNPTLRGNWKSDFATNLLNEVP